MNQAAAFSLPETQASPSVLPPPEGASIVVSHIPIALLRTNLDALRSHASGRQPTESTAELPIRIAPRQDGSFEVIDGFKRLARWIEHGHTLAPVVIESPRSSPQNKVLLLRTNAPPRTTTPMDEARVIESLIHEDGLSLTAAANLLGRRKSWVVRRYALATRLSAEAQKNIDQGSVGPTLAYALCPLSENDQRALLRSVERHSLREREALIVVSAWRAASSDAERSSLLANPIPVVRPNPHTASPLGPLATRLEQRLENVRQALVDLASFDLPGQGLTDAERRRLQAKHHSILNLLLQTARASEVLCPFPKPQTKENTYEQPERIQQSDLNQRETEGESRNNESQQLKAAFEASAARASHDCGASPAGLRNPADRTPCLPRPQDRPTCALAERAAQADLDATFSEQTRSLSRTDPPEGRQKPDPDPHPARDPRGRIFGRSHDPVRLCELDPITAGCEPHSQASLRDGPC